PLRPREAEATSAGRKLGLTRVGRIAHTAPRAAPRTEAHLRGRLAAACGARALVHRTSRPGALRSRHCAGLGPLRALGATDAPAVRDGRARGIVARPERV